MTKLMEDYTNFFKKKFENKHLKEILSITKNEIEIFVKYLNDNFDCCVEVEFTINNQIKVYTSCIVEYEDGTSNISHSGILMDLCKVYNNIFNGMYRMNEYLENETHMNILVCLFDEKEPVVLNIFEKYFYLRVVEEERQNILSKVNNQEEVVVKRKRI